MILHYEEHEDGRGWRIEDRRSPEEFAILNLPSSILNPRPNRLHVLRDLRGEQVSVIL